MTPEDIEWQRMKASRQGLGALALLGVAAGFKLGGGKIAAEYLRGASRM